MTTYTGTLDISGSVQATGGGQTLDAAFTGDFADTLTASLDAAGNGNATETLDGSITVVEDGQTESVPYNLTTPSFPFQLGTFDLNQQQPVAVPGWQFDIVLTGSVSIDQSQISERETVDLSGSYDGYTFSGYAVGSALLLAQPEPETISGTEADQQVIDTSTLSPFQHVVVSDLNPAQTDTATVTLSDAANGTLSNLGGGGYDAETGVYTVTGSAAAVSTALDGLVFTPTPEQAAAGTTVATGFTINVTDTAGETATDRTTSVVTTETGPSLTTLASFNGAAGEFLYAGLYANGFGDLFGTVPRGGADGFGRVFEVAKSGPGYTGTPITVASFNGSGAAYPMSGLVADTSGDLFGTTQGGANGKGAVFEIPATFGGAPTILASIDGTDTTGAMAGLAIDGAGDLFGTTQGGGADGDGAVFELAKTDNSYAGAPTILASFDGANGKTPVAGLVADGAGDLFGTTSAGGTNGFGTAFEIPWTGNGYGPLTTLFSFAGANGADPAANLIIDGQGNLFGTTEQGGAFGYGTAFEIAYGNGGYTSAPTVLVSFNGTNGAYPQAGLLADAADNLFGTTSGGGPGSDGTVFEIARTDGGFAGTPKSLIVFNGSDGIGLLAGLVADSRGNLFGVTHQVGASGGGSVFEITDSGFVACYLAGTRIGAPTGERAVETLAAGQLVLTASGAARPIVWLGHRRVDCRRHPRPETVWPVRVRRDALGNGRPHRDLFLSPDHAVFLDGVLIPIRCLINGDTIAQERRDEVTYWHVELDRHDILLAEGLPAESFLDVGNRGAFDNAAGPVMLHPDFARRAWAANACAELILGGPPLILAKRRVQVQATLLSLRVADDRDGGAEGTCRLAG